MTKLMFCRIEISSSGLPLTATISAIFPFSKVPNMSEILRSSEAETVADFMASYAGT